MSGCLGCAGRVGQVVVVLAGIALLWLNGWGALVAFAIVLGFFLSYTRDLWTGTDERL